MAWHTHQVAILLVPSCYTETGICSCWVGHLAREQTHSPVRPWVWRVPFPRQKEYYKKEQGEGIMLNTESVRKPAINYITKRTRKRSLPRGKGDTRRIRRRNYPKRKNILNSDCLLEKRIYTRKKRRRKSSKQEDEQGSRSEEENYERNCVIRDQNGENSQKRKSKALEAQLTL